MISMVRKVCAAGIFIGLLIIFGCGDVENSTATQNTNEIQGQVSTNTIEIKAPKETVNKVTLSKGKLIAFIDSDDTWHKDKLKKQL